VQRPFAFTHSSLVRKLHVNQNVLTEEHQKISFLVQEAKERKGNKEIQEREKLN
jgi:hypothetical protein